MAYHDVTNVSWITYAKWPKINAFFSHELVLGPGQAKCRFIVMCNSYMISEEEAKTSYAFAKALSQFNTLLTQQHVLEAVGCTCRHALLLAHRLANVICATVCQDLWNSNEEHKLLRSCQRTFNSLWEAILRFCTPYLARRYISFSFVFIRSSLSFSRHYEASVLEITNSLGRSLLILGW
jgi:hypothetical protein